MWTKLFGLIAAAGVIATCGTAPALAVCNPGTPNCIRAHSPWLANASSKSIRATATSTATQDRWGYAATVFPAARA
jgi:hypothetical protein